MKKARFFLALIIAAAILIRPQSAVTCAQQAMRLWYASVAPALFPFLALMPLLTGPDACAVYERIFSAVMRPLFRLPGSAAPAMIIGMISGSPGGAVALTRIASQTGMRMADLRRIAPVVCGVGPAYLIMGVGVGLFGSVQLGVKLAAVQLAVQLVLLLLTRFLKDDDARTVPQMDFLSNENGIRHAVEAILSVCGHMVLFSVAAGVAAGFAGAEIGRILLIIADLPSGMAALSAWNFPGRFALMGMAVGFGGICIAAQNMEYLKPIGVSWRAFLTLKFAQSALCGAVSGVVLRDFQPLDIPSAAGSGAPYAFSLLIALVLCAPVLVYLSNKLFLNKRKSADNLST